MKRFSLQKVVFVWLLLAVFAFPDVIKSIHVQHHCGCHNEVCETNGKKQSQTEHDCEKCLICQFSLFSFIPSEEIKLTYCILEFFSSPSVYKQEYYISFLNSCYKRGPPCI